MPIDSFCDGMTENCPTTWTAAQDVASWRCGPGTDGMVTLSTCGDIHVASVAYIDAGKDFYHDASGQLFRVEDFVNVTQKCVAGTGHVDPCNDPNARTLCSPAM